MDSLSPLKNRSIVTKWKISKLKLYKDLRATFFGAICERNITSDYAGSDLWANLYILWHCEMTMVFTKRQGIFLSEQTCNVNLQKF